MIRGELCRFGGSSASSLLLFALLVLSALALLASPASAALTHSGSFSAPGSGDGQLDIPERADVDQDTGNLFIADSDNDRIQVFAPDGTSSVYLDQFTDASIDAPLGVAIDQSDGSIYVSDTDDVVKFTSALALDGTFTSPGITGPLAVDPTDGDLLVADTTANTIKRFNSDGTADLAPAIDGSSSPDGAFTGLYDIAVNSSGDVYVIDADGPIESGPSGSPSPTGNSRAERFGSDGSHQATLTPVGPNQRPAAVAVNPVTDTVYVSGEQDAIYRDQNPTLHTFDASNDPIDDQVISEGPPYISVAGLAVDAPGGRTYVVHDYGYWMDGGTFGSGPGVLIYSVVPSAEATDATDVTETTATLNGTVDGAGTTITDCYFEYGPTASYGQTAPCDPDPGSTPGQVAVLAQISGLELGTGYHFRLHAENANGSDNSSDKSFATLSEPVVSATTSQDRTATTVTLKGKVNPKNFATTYQFEYGTDDSYGSVIPLDPASVGSGSSPVSVSRFLDGLEPQTTYHFRLSATNSVGTTTGPDRTFTTLPETVEPEQCPNAEHRTGKSAHLPDCRAYELVSPTDKNGGDITQMTSRTRVSDDGSAVAFESQSVFADALGTAGSTTYLAQRGEGDWETHNVWPKVNPGDFAGISATHGAGFHFGSYGPDLENLFFASPEPLAGTPEASHDLINLYQRTDTRSPGAGNFELLTGCSYDCSGVALGSPTPSNRPDVAGVSDDRSKVLVNTVFPLTEDSPAGTNVPKLFLVEDGEPTWVGQIPAGSDAECGDGGPACVAAPRSTADGMWDHDSSSLTRPMIHNFLSADGTRVFFNVNPTSNSSNRQSRGNLYQLDTQGTASSDDDTTMKVNASELDTPEAFREASLQYMTPDGEHATLITRERLTEDADASPNQTKLYLWSRVPDNEGDHLQHIAGGASGEVKQVLALAADGENVYFTGADGLVPGEPPVGHNRVLYHWNAEEGLSYIGKWKGGVGGWFDGGYLGLEHVLSADGTKLAFATDQTPLDEDRHGTCVSGVGGGGTSPCRQVYLYDADSGQLPTCVSCPPSGAEGTGESWTYTASNKSSVLEGVNTERLLSSNGRFVFFSTAQSLLPEDTNGPCELSYIGAGPSEGAPCADVYAYDSETGQLSLLSTGKDDSGSYFLDATPDGSTVLIGSRERLVGADNDASYDVYAVRMNGGLASQNPADPDPPCTDAKSCRGESTGDPADEEVASKDSEGEGNPAVKPPADCSKPEKKVAKLKKRQSKLRAKAKRASGKRVKKLRRKAQRVKQKKRAAKRKLARCERGES